jgi:TolB-like protein
MKAWIYFCVIAILCACAVNAPAYADPRIAVLEFSANNIDDSYAKAVRNIIETELYKKKLQMLDRKNIKRILFEMGSDRVCKDDRCAIQQGKIVSADYAVMGDVTTAGACFIITVRIVDVKSGMIMFTDSTVVPKKEEILDKSRNLSNTVADHLGVTVRKDEDKPVEDTSKKVKCTPALYIQGGYLLPVAYLDDKASFGYNVSLAGGVSIHNFFTGIKTGFYRLHNHQKKPYATIVPIMAGGNYSFMISKFFISPGLSFGVSYISITGTGKNAYELLVNPEVNIGYQITSMFSLFAYSDYFCIIEKKRGIQFLSIGLGGGFLF